MDLPTAILDKGNAMRLITLFVLISSLYLVAIPLGSCGGSDNSLPGPDASVPQHKRVFVTAAGYRGDFGGVTGGDTICNTTAVAANLDGTWKAWLSDSTTNAIDRIDDVGPWYLLNGKVVFNNKTNTTASHRRLLRRGGTCATGMRG
jgi:hypothetical protein